MNDFSIKRTTNIARLLWPMYKAEFIKRTLLILAIVSLYMVINSYTRGLKYGFSDMSKIYEFIGGLYVGVFAGWIITPGAMFYPYSKIKEKYQNRGLLMLPASNLEKYITHYAFTWLSALGILCGMVIADLMQYAVHTMMGHEGAMLIIQYMVPSKIFETFFGNVNTPMVSHPWSAMALWLHSFCVLGVTFFKSYKHGVNLTLLTLFVFGMLIFALFGFGIVVETWWNNVLLFNVMFLLLTPVNFLLSYHLFCSQQITARFINI